MKLFNQLSKPTRFGISIGLLLLIIFASLQDWGVTGVIFIVLAYFVGFASGKTDGQQDGPAKSLEEHIQSLEPEIRREITRLTKEDRFSDAENLIRANTGLGSGEARRLVEGPPTDEALPIQPLRMQ